jgi:hypothetical protein
MKKTIAKLRNNERIIDAAKKIVMALCSLSVFDVALAFLGGPYLSRNVGTFLGKSNAAILSDLLFLEGAVIFAVGSFLALGLPFKPYKERTDDVEPPSKKRIHPSILLMIIGASLIGLSITVGTLLV